MTQVLGLTFPCSIEKESMTDFAICILTSGAVSILSVYYRSIAEPMIQFVGLSGSKVGYNHPSTFVTLIRNFLFVIYFVAFLMYVRRLSQLVRANNNAHNKLSVRKRLAEVTEVAPKTIRSIQTVGSLLTAYGVESLRLKTVNVIASTLKGNGFSKANKISVSAALDVIVSQFAKRNLVYRNLKGRVNKKYLMCFERIPPPVKSHVVLTYLIDGLDVLEMTDDELTILVAVYTILAHTIPLGVFPEAKGKNKRHRFVKGSPTSRGIDLADAQYFMDLYEAFVTDVIDDEKFDQVLANYGIDDDMLQVMEDAYYIYLDNPEADSARAWQSYLSQNQFGWEEVEDSDEDEDSFEEDRRAHIEEDDELMEDYRKGHHEHPDDMEDRTRNRFSALAERDYDDAPDFPDYDPEGRKRKCVVLPEGNSPLFKKMVNRYRKWASPGPVFVEGRTVIKMVKQPTGQSTMRHVLQSMAGVTWQWLSRWLSWLSGQQTILMPYIFPPGLSVKDARKYCEQHMDSFREENPWVEEAFKTSTEFVYEFTTPLAMHQILVDQFPDGRTVDPSELDKEPEDSIPMMAKNVYRIIDQKIQSGEIQFEAKHGNKELMELLQVLLQEIGELRTEVRNIKFVQPEGRCPDALQLVTPYADNKIAFLVDSENSKKRWATILAEGCYLTCVTKVIHKGQSRCFTTAHATALMSGGNPNNIFVVTSNENITIPIQEWFKGDGDLIFTSNDRLNRAMSSTGSFKEQLTSVKSQVALVMPRATSPTRFVTTVSSRADLTNDGFVFRNITDKGDCGTAYVTPDNGVFAIHAGSYGDDIGNVGVPLLLRYFAPPAGVSVLLPLLGSDLGLPLQADAPVELGTGSFSVPTVSTTVSTQPQPTISAPPAQANGAVAGRVNVLSSTHIVGANPGREVSTDEVSQSIAVNPEMVVSNEARSEKSKKPKPQKASSGQQSGAKPKAAQSGDKPRTARKTFLVDDFTEFQSWRKAKQEGKSQSAVVLPKNSSSPLVT